MSLFLDSKTGERTTLRGGEVGQPLSRGPTNIIQLDESTFIQVDEIGHVFGILSTKDLLGDPLLLSRIRDSIASAIPRKENESAHSLESRYSSLTAREREVADLLVAAKHPKRIARELGLSPKTIEFHRSNVLKKMHVDSVVELTRVMLLKVNT